MNVADYVGQALATLGVGHAFGVVGSGNFAVTAALRGAGVPYAAARHEGGAATMADAYARMSGRLAVLSTHQGCGLTNAVTGITEAAKSRTPLLVLTADTAGAAVHSNFNIDQDALARSVGAIAERVHSAQSAPADVTRAYRAAVHQRRTVVLNLPLDVQAQQMPAGTDPGALAAPPPGRPVRPAAESVTDLVGLLATAQRPVFVAGRGARGAGPQLAELARRAGALLATSAVAHGLFGGDPFAVGISGGFSSPLTAELIAGADLIVGWGCALNDWTLRHGTLVPPDAVLVQIDIEDAALGRNRPIALGVVGDCAQTAAAVSTELVAELGSERTGYRTAAVRAAIAERARWNAETFDDLSTADTIDPRLLSRELDAILPAQRTVSVDSGNFMGYPSAYLAVPDEFGFCFTQAFQSIGLGLTTAIGTALAQPQRVPVAALGDGGFWMGIAELETVVRLGLPMVVVVYDDAAYGAEIHHFAGPAVDMSTVTFPDADLAAVARGYGCDAVTVRRVEDLEAVRAWVAGPRDRPLLIDAKISSDGGAWWLAEAFKGH